MLCLACCQTAGAIMDSRSFEELLRGDAFLPPRATALVPEIVKFAVKELAEIDVWAKRNKIKSRSEAIRLLVEKGLKMGAAGTCGSALGVKFSDPPADT
jgi:hypothetical protein